MNGEGDTISPPPSPEEEEGARERIDGYGVRSVRLAGAKPLDLQALGSAISGLPRTMRLHSDE